MRKRCQISSLFSWATRPVFFHSSINSVKRAVVFFQSLLSRSASALATRASFSRRLASCSVLSSLTCSFLRLKKWSRASLKRSQISSERCLATGPMVFHSSIIANSASVVFFQSVLSFSFSACSQRSIFFDKLSRSSFPNSSCLACLSAKNAETAFSIRSANASFRISGTEAGRALYFFCRVAKVSVANFKSGAWVSCSSSLQMASFSAITASVRWRSCSSQASRRVNALW